MLGGYVIASHWQHNIPTYKGYNFSVNFIEFSRSPTCKELKSYIASKGIEYCDYIVLLENIFSEARHFAEDSIEYSSFKNAYYAAKDVTSKEMVKDSLVNYIIDNTIKEYNSQYGIDEEMKTSLLAHDIDCGCID